MSSKYTVAVRLLCEFTARQGDLDLRFTPSPTALQGMAGHDEVRSRRGPHYQREVSLAGTFGHLQVRGRADGYDAELQRIEEIKTHRGDIGRMPANHRQLHWAQARVYAWLMCDQLKLPQMDVALVYHDIGSGNETLFTERRDRAWLKEHFDALCGRFLAWADQESAHRLNRDAALAELEFPHPEFRTGQRLLAEAVYKATANGRCLLAQAPTGIGKTVGTLFPVLKAMPVKQLDKVFYLTAKTPGRQLALDAMAQLRRPRKQGRGLHDPALRVLEMVARDKACEHPDKACHGESCPLARGFYDRLPRARQACVETGVEAGVWSRQALRDIALSEGICPYYLGQDLLRWADVLVGDYNHYFDLNAGLYSLTVSESWRVSILVDEAHNLVSRGRQMYTATMSRGVLARVRTCAPAALKKPLDRLHRQWSALVKAQAGPYAVHDPIPDKFVQALQNMTAAMAAFYADEPAHADPFLQGLYFDALYFLRLVELHGPHSLCDLTLKTERGPANSAPDSVLCVRNVVPAPMLKDRWSAAHGVTLFSATLSPSTFLVDMLGLPADTAWVDVPSAFDSRQLDVRVTRNISTRFPDRERSLGDLVGLMSQQFRQAPGNYLAFFSSFDYLQMVASAMQLASPDVALWLQSRGMSEPERDAFLQRFTLHSQGIGFAVLGGAFGEGIDLPGARLIGAFIATLGMPQVNPVNEQIRQRVQDCVGHGYDYTYLFPGIQKVVQAAGRVIRTPQDRGVVYLMDDRFARPQVQALLPAWWRVQ